MGGFVPLSFGAPRPAPLPTRAKFQAAGRGAELTVSSSRFHSRFASCFTNQWPMNQQKRIFLQSWWIVAFLGFISSPSPTSFTLSSIKFFSLHTFNSYFLLKLLWIVLKTALKKTPQVFPVSGEWTQSPVTEILQLLLLPDAPGIRRRGSSGFRTIGFF